MERMTERYLDTDEVRSLFPDRNGRLLSRSGLYTAIDKGHITKPIKIGGKNYWREGALMRHLMQREAEEDAA